MVMLESKVASNDTDPKLDPFELKIIPNLFIFESLRLTVLPRLERPPRLARPIE